MNDVYEQIRAQLESFPLYDEIKAGRVTRKCHAYARELHHHLEGKIPGLTLMQVATVELPEFLQAAPIKIEQQHGWIAAHHPDVGFFIIDPTAGQFLHHSREEGKGGIVTKGFNDVFIGTEEELMETGRRFGKGAGEMLLLWSPVVVPADKVGKQARDLNIDDPLWHEAPFKILRGVYEMKDTGIRPVFEKDPLDRLALWAHEVESRGENWKEVLSAWMKRSGMMRGGFPDPRREFERGLAERVEMKMEAIGRQAGSCMSVG